MKTKSKQGILKILLTIGILATFIITSTGCEDSKNNKLVYESNGIEFILNKNCIVDISPVETGIENNHLVAIKLKNNTSCAKKLNSLIANNIGSELYIYYNSELIIKSHIASPLSTENGYRQIIPDKIKFDDVLSAYN